MPDPLKEFVDRQIAELTRPDFDDIRKDSLAQLKRRKNMALTANENMRDVTSLPSRPFLARIDRRNKYVAARQSLRPSRLT